MKVLQDQKSRKKIDNFQHQTCISHSIVDSTDSLRGFLYIPVLDNVYLIKDRRYLFIVYDIIRPL